MSLISILLMSTTVYVLIALVGGILIGLGSFFLIIKLKNRNKNRKVKINSKPSDYQFQFKLNTGQFINDLKNSSDSKQE